MNHRARPLERMAMSLVVNLECAPGTWIFKPMDYEEEHGSFEPEPNDGEEELPELPENQRSGREKSGRRSDTRRLPSPATQDPDIVTGIVFFLALIAIVVVIVVMVRKQSGTTESSPTSDPPVETMRRVNANQLNLRSGPGKNHPVVKVFTRNESIVTVGEPQNIGGELWIQASTPDGRVRGWIARKFLNP